MIAPVALTLLALSSLALLPSIGNFITSDGTPMPINPIAETVTFNQGNLSAVTVDIDVHFGDLSATISGATGVLQTYDSLDTLSNVSGTRQAHFPGLVFNVAAGTALSGDLYVPDLPYWEYYDGPDFWLLNYAVAVSTNYPVGVYYTRDFNFQSGNFILTYSNDLAEGGIVDGIADGLGVIGNLGGALLNGFDGVFMNGTTLSTIGSFSFILFGLGISVGIVKKCFNWVTGRHGM